MRHLCRASFAFRKTARHSAFTETTAIRIITGAPIPKDADSVIQFEDTEEEAGYAKIFRKTFKYTDLQRRVSK